MIIRRTVVGLALCAGAGMSHAAPFTVSGAQLGFASDLGFIQESFLVDDASVSVNTLLSAGAVWDRAFRAAADILPQAYDAIAASTFVGGIGGSELPTQDNQADSTLLFDVQPFSVNPEGPLRPGDPDFAVVWEGGPTFYSSAPGVVNGVSGEYYFMAQLVVPAGEEVRVARRVDTVIFPEIDVGASVSVFASEFERTADGSLFASFEQYGETYWWTVFNTGTIDGNDVYRVYVSDVQVIPAPVSALALIALGCNAARRRR